MSKKEKTNLFDRVAENPALLARVLEGRSKPYESYIANLIFKSEELLARREMPWEYKSLLHYGEEEFSITGSFLAIYQSTDDGLKVWHQQAAKALANEVGRSVIYEEEEGLVLFVCEEDGYIAPPNTMTLPMDTSGV